MRVLTATVRYPPAPGGVETHAHQVASRLVRRGHEVVVHTSDLLREHPFEHMENGQDLVDVVRVVRHRARRPGEALHYTVMPGLAGALREPADVVHPHGFGYFHTNLMALRRRLRGTPLVITPHYHPAESFEGGWARQVMRRVYDVEVADWVFDQADAVIAVSRAELDAMVHHLSDLDKARVIPNGIDPSRFEDLPDPRAFKEQGGIEGPMVLYVGRMAFNKRMEHVIRALPHLVSEEPGLRLVIVGPDDGAGTRWKELTASVGVEDSVVFGGFLSEEDKVAALAAADVFVLPSEWEAFGIVLLEAMASRTPCVCSDRGGPKEVVEDGRTGLIAPYGDERAWREALLTLIGDPHLRRRMGEAGRQRAVSEYSWDSIVDRIEGVYNDVVVGR